MKTYAYLVAIETDDEILDSKGFRNLLIDKLESVGFQFKEIDVELLGEIDVYPEDLAQDVKNELLS